MARLWGSIFLAVLLVASPGAAGAAEIWSEPLQTKQWSEAEYVEPWTKAEYTDLWEVELSGEEAGEIDPFLLDFANLFGSWRIWLNSIPLGEGKVQQGLDQGGVYIGSDGTYLFQHAAWSRDVVAGNWRLSYPREINGEVVQAIILLDGPGDTDWAVAPEPGGKVRLLWAMKWDDGSALWIFDSELYRD
ncbi:MAG TPA: hypothetical protein PLM25_06015 [Limnochordia bacterium]|nr:hypothetical protein [Limnochordia bacterium]